MTTAVDVDHVRSLLVAELAAVSGAPPDSVGATTLLADLGIDSLDLVEVLLAVREQLFTELGLDADDVEDPPSLPWLETVGELVDFVHASIPEHSGPPE